MSIYGKNVNDSPPEPGRTRAALFFFFFFCGLRCGVCVVFFFLLFLSDIKKDKIDV